MNADARKQAWEYYQAAGRDMDADLAILSAQPQGVVLLMPQLVALVRPVHSRAPELWSRLEHIFPTTDAWYVHLLVGDLALARKLATALAPQRWLCFQRGLRNSTPHRLPWAAFLNKTTQTLNTMGFSSTSNYGSATTTIPVVTQTTAEESQQATNQSEAQKKGLLSTILSSHRRKETTSAVDSANSTLG